jgi:hypothetical protein
MREPRKNGTSAGLAWPHPKHRAGRKNGVAGQSPNADSIAAMLDVPTNDGTEKGQVCGGELEQLAVDYVDGGHVRHSS